MKILSDKQFDEFVEKIRRESFRAGYDKGYEFGLREGLTADKSGIYMSKSGLFAFENGELKTILTEKE